MCLFDVFFFSAWVLLCQTKLVSLWKTLHICYSWHISSSLNLLMLKVSIQPHYCPRGPEWPEPDNSSNIKSLSFCSRLSLAWPHIGLLIRHDIRHESRYLSSFEGVAISLWATALRSYYLLQLVLWLRSNLCQSWHIKYTATSLKDTNSLVVM